MGNQQTLGISYQKKGEWWLGVMSLSIPIYVFTLSLSHFIYKVKGIELIVYEPIALSLLVTLVLIFYYKKNNRGRKIVEYYDNNKKMNTQNKVYLLLMLYYFSMFIVFLALVSAINFYVVY